ncbi:ST2B1 Sulfotransferase, partial [Nyctiprogne leucopyga]|nr:ST2B1 Sulfotransferase [Nyctiprogne leucopyga]
MQVHYVTYEAIKFPLAYNSEHSLSFTHNEFLVRDDDIFNVTYPRSGTRGTVWMTEILSLIRSRGCPGWNRTVLSSDRVPWFSTRLGLESALSYLPPRLLTCHLPRHIFPKSCSCSSAKVIYTLQNPRDVVVSYYYFSKMCSSCEDPTSFEQFLRDFLNGERHGRGWVVSPITSVSRVFCCCPLMMAVKPSLPQERGEWLRRKAKHFWRDMQAHKSLLCFEADKWISLTSGIWRDWENHFTVAQSESFDRIYQERMQGLNVTFPWDQ